MHELSILASFGPYILTFSGRVSRNISMVAKIVDLANQSRCTSKICVCFVRKSCIPGYIQAIQDTTGKFQSCPGHRIKS